VVYKILFRPMDTKCRFIYVSARVIIYYNVFIMIK
jgi:hypothetical protein